MTASITVNRQCSRCPREDRQEVSLEELAKLAKTGLKAPPAIRIIVDGKEIVTKDNLCHVCRKVVERYTEQIGRQLQHKSSERGEADEPDVEG
jgi:hypothetical protein